MNKKVKLGALLAVAAVAPAIVAPQLVSHASAQATAEYPDVPKGHWAYDALNTLSTAGIIEGRPGGKYYGSQPMTRYEFAVAIARLLKTGVGVGGKDGAPGAPGAPGAQGPKGDKGDTGGVDMTRAEVNDLIKALRTEFATELANLGVRVGALEDRVGVLEAKVAKPPRLTVTPGILHRSGAANYISNAAAPFGGPTIASVTGNGVGPNTNGVGLPGLGVGNAGGLPNNSVFRNSQYVNGKFSYTDFELRLTDRVTDRLSVNAALRSLGGNEEDNWAGNNGSNINLREAFAVANLGDRSFLGAKGLNVILGRQHTKLAQGLLYDNQLSPTDQLHAQFNIGPAQFDAISGSTNNNVTQTYANQGAVSRIGSAVGGVVPGAGNFVGFAGPGAGTVAGDDNETLLRGSFNLFKISGNPVALGVTRQFDGYQSQRADSLDLNVPLFNRTIGVEWVRQRNYANGASSNDAKAYNITLPVLRARVLDLNVAYGKASDNFEYQATSAANPYARTYGEAIFDRPLALGAPLIANGNNAPGGSAATFMAAKKVFDFNGTLRILRRIPLDFRYYQADGTGGVDLGKVYSVGSTFNISPGLDLEVKYGQYEPETANTIKYFRVGANVGF